MKVLLIDDHPLILAALQSVIQGLGDNVVVSAASSGRTAHFFVPDPDKTFHRGSTDYFVTERKVDIGAFDSPTFTGLPVGVVEKVGKRDMQVVTDVPLTNGDASFVGQIVGGRLDEGIALGVEDLQIVAAGFAALGLHRSQGGASGGHGLALAGLQLMVGQALA